MIYKVFVALHNRLKQLFMILMFSSINVKDSEPAPLLQLFRKSYPYAAVLKGIKGTGGSPLLDQISWNVSTGNRYWLHVITTIVKFINYS